MKQATKLRPPQYPICLQLRSLLTITYDLAEYFAFQVGGK